MKKAAVFLPLLILIGCKTDKECNLQKEVRTKLDNHREMVQVVDGCDKNRLISEKQCLIVSKDSVIADGYYKEFYPNGKLKIIAFYNHGIQDSTCIKYYENGEKESQSFQSEGAFYGPQESYYNSGQIKNIDFLKNDSTIWFTIKYDTSGIETSVKGYPLRIIAQPGFESIKVGEPSVLINEIITLENAKSILNIKLIDKNSIVQDTTISDFIQFKNTYVYGYSKKIEKIGDYKYVATVKIIDKRDNHIITEDSIVKFINVK